MRDSLLDDQRVNHGEQPLDQSGGIVDGLEEFSATDGRSHSLGCRYSAVASSATKAGYGTLEMAEGAWVWPGPGPLASAVYSPSSPWAVGAGRYLASSGLPDCMAATSPSSSPQRSPISRSTRCRLPWSRGPPLALQSPQAYDIGGGASFFAAHHQLALTNFEQPRQLAW